jgi:FtsH-binding integral membrane protein
VRKVYSLLSVMLLTTTIFCTFSVMSLEFSQFQNNNNWLFWVCFVGSIATIIPLACSSNLSKTVPANYLLLFAFNLFESYMVSFCCTLYTPESVVLAAAATLTSTLSLTFYAFITKRDFTDCYSFMIGNS